MKQQTDPGWVGWKSAILGAVFLYFAMRLGLQPAQQQVVPVQQIQQVASTVAEEVTEKKKDYFGGFSASERDDMIAGIVWESNESYEADGDPRAKKGGTFRYGAESYPPTVRTVGKNSNDATLSLVESLVYQSLLSINANPTYYYPCLADQWSIGEDKKTYYFKLDPDAKWADGQPVRAQDFVATWDLLTDKGIQDPFRNQFWQKIERPVALSDSVVMVRSKEVSWQTFLYVATQLFVFPEHVLKGMDGAKFLKEYNNRMILGSGPYAFDSAERPRNIIFKRRKDFWGLNKKWAAGLYNFDKIVFQFVADENLNWEKFKKGESDYTVINIARRWVQEMDFDSVLQGHIVRRKVFNYKPTGTQGFSFNIREFPFDDINIRKAFAYAWNRDLLMDKLMFNEYDFTDSYFQNSAYMSPDIPKVRYDPEKAKKFLKESGWVKRNTDGYLVKDGKELAVTLNYVGKGIEKFFTVYQEALKELGIRLNLQEVTWATNIKEVGQRNFKLTYGAYTGSSFPNPEYSFHSRYADQPDSGNRWGYKNARVDEITSQYMVEFDPEERVKLLRELDSIVNNDYLMAYAWYAPAERLAYWNKFGMPEKVLTKTGDYRTVFSLWWYDEDKAKALKSGISSNSSLPLEPIRVCHEGREENCVKQGK